MLDCSQAGRFRDLLRLSIAALVALPSAASAGPSAPPGPPQVEGSGVVVVYLPELAPGTLRAKASRGRLGPPLQDGDLVRFAWSAEGEPGAPVVLELKYRTQSGEKVEAPVSLSLVAPEAPRLLPTAALAPGATSLKVALEPPAPADALLAATRGQLRSAGGALDWAAGPAAKAPAVGLLAVVDPRAPARPLLVPVAEQVRQSVTQAAPPDSQNTLIMGNVGQFGPLRASPAGTVAFDLSLDPRAPSAQLLTVTREGREERRAVQLPGAERPALLIAPAPPQVNDPRRASALTVAVLDREGRPWSGEAPQLSATGAAVDPARALAPGLYVYDWRPQAGAARAEFTARVGGVEGKAVVPLGAAPPAAVASVERLATKPTAVKLAIELSSPAGAWTGRGPTVDLQGAKAAGGVLDRKGGRFELSATLAAADGAAFALVQPPSTGGAAPARLLAWAEPLDGDRTALRVAVEDGGGRGVGGQALRLDGPSDARLPGPVTGPGGVATAVISGPGVYTVALGELRAAVIVRADGLAQPALWTDEAIAAQRRWAEAAPIVSLAAPKAAVVAVAAAAPSETPTSSASTSPSVTASAAEAGPAAPAGAGPAASRAAPARPAAGGGTPALRASLTLGAGTGRYDSAQEGFAVGPEEVALTAGGLADGAGLGVFAAELRVLAFPKNGAWGVDLGVEGARSTYAGAYAFPSGELDSVKAELDPVSALSLRLGARYRKALAGPLSVQGLAAVERGQAGVVLWADGAPVWTDAPLTGLRVGGGLLLDLDRLWLDLTVAESLFPWPAQSTLGLGLELPLQGPLWLRAGVDHQRRSLRYDAGEEIAVQAQQTVARVGLSFTH